MVVAADAYLTAIERELGAEAIELSAEAVARYGDTTMPSGVRRVRAVVLPRSPAEVVAMVRLANEHHVSLYPVSAGHNLGLGTRSPVRDDQIVVDLGRRMNRILELNEELGYAVVEPGVTFQALHDELVRRGDKLMISATSGPPLGSVLGNALDKGAGYSSYFDHFGTLCGFEVVLGNGSTIRTGDGSLHNDQLPNWPVSKYTFGPILDGLFAQSNFGIVVRAAIWLMPRPPVIRTFHAIFERDTDIGSIIDAIRPLKLTNFVPTLFRVTNDLYAVGPEERAENLGRRSDARDISAEERRTLREKHGLGAWQASAAFYAGSEADMAPMLARVNSHFRSKGALRIIDHAQAQLIHPLLIASDAFSGRPSTAELPLLSWRPGGGAIWFLPGTPMSGRTAAELDVLARDLFAQHGFDYIIMHVAGARFARSLYLILFDRRSTDECRRADACYRALTSAYAIRGIGVGRAAIDYHGLHMDLQMPAFQQTVLAIKSALDPNGVIAPGKYGIG
jgi:4-cresol dehydrogenase (hydroxylating)